jgi:hypothetical protein
MFIPPRRPQGRGLCARSSWECWRQQSLSPLFKAPSPVLALFRMRTYRQAGQWFWCLNDRAPSSRGKCRWPGRSGWTSIQITDQRRIRGNEFGENQSSHATKKSTRSSGRISAVSATRGGFRRRRSGLCCVYVSASSEVRKRMNSVAAAHPGALPALDVSLDELFDGTLGKSRPKKR